MQFLQEKELYRLISACRHYMSLTSSEHTYDEYSLIIEKLENHILQNLPEAPEGKTINKD
jgi:hypothetical protein